MNYTSQHDSPPTSGSGVLDDVIDDPYSGTGLGGDLLGDLDHSPGNIVVVH